MRFDAPRGKATHLLAATISRLCAAANVACPSGVRRLQRGLSRHRRQHATQPPLPSRRLRAAATPARRSGRRRSPRQAHAIGGAAHSRGGAGRGLRPEQQCIRRHLRAASDGGHCRESWTGLPLRMADGRSTARAKIAKCSKDNKDIQLVFHTRDAIKGAQLRAMRSSDYSRTILSTHG